MARNKDIIALAIIIAWFYLLLAVILNPSTTPDAQNNPLIPFLSAKTTFMLWPIVLTLTPFVVVAARQLTQPRGRTAREVSPQEFARIQARAHRMSAKDKESARRQAQSSSTTATKVASTKPTRPAEAPSRAETGHEEKAEKTTPAASEIEFTPPPTTSRVTPASKGAITDEESVAEEYSLSQEAPAYTEDVDENKRIDELEAEKGAVHSLMNRLEEMKDTQDMKPELYEKLKNKYLSEIRKIDSKIESLLTKDKSGERTSEN